MQGDISPYRKYNSVLKNNRNYTSRTNYQIDQKLYSPHKQVHPIIDAINNIQNRLKRVISTKQRIKSRYYPKKENFQQQNIGISQSLRYTPKYQKVKKCHFYKQESEDEQKQFSQNKSQKYEMQKNQNNKIHVVIEHKQKTNNLQKVKLKINKLQNQNQNLKLNNKILQKKLQNQCQSKILLEKNLIQVITQKVIRNQQKKKKKKKKIVETQNLTVTIKKFENLLKKVVPTVFQKSKKRKNNKRNNKRKKQQEQQIYLRTQNLDDFQQIDRNHKKRNDLHLYRCKSPERMYRNTTQIDETQKKNNIDQYKSNIDQFKTTQRVYQHSFQRNNSPKFHEPTYFPNKIERLQSDFDCLLNKLRKQSQECKKIILRKQMGLLASKINKQKNS